LNPGDPSAPERLKEVIAAYRILGDARCRDRYDRVNSLFGPRKRPKDEVIEEKSFLWSQAARPESSYSSSIMQRKAQARRAALLSLFLIIATSILIALAMFSDGFSRNPLHRIHRWRAPSVYPVSSSKSSSSTRDWLNDYWYLSYWQGEFAENPSNNTARIHLGQERLRLARLEFKRGNYDLAAAHIEAARAVCPDIVDVRNTASVIDAAAKHVRLSEERKKI
jgi:curved DNA-binding protein CbpA